MNEFALAPSRSAGVVTNSDAFSRQTFSPGTDFAGVQRLRTSSLNSAEPSAQSMRLTSVTVPGVSSASVENAPNKNDALEKDLAKLQTEQDNFTKRIIKPATDTTEGFRKNLVNSQRNLDESGALDWLSGTTSGYKKAVEVDRKSYEDQAKQLALVKERYEGSMEAAKLAKEMLATAKKYDGLGYNSQADALRKTAADMIEKSHQSIQGLTSVDPQSLRVAAAGLKEVSEKLEAGISRLETAQTVTKVVMEVNHQVGVGVGYALGGPGGAALVNQGLRMVESAGGQIAEVNLGNKTWAQASADFGQSSLDAVVESSVIFVAGAAGNKLGAVAKAIKGPVIGKVVEIAGTGLVQSGGEAISIGYQYLQLQSQFEKSAAGLKGAERQAAYDQFMADNGMDLAGVSKRLGISFASGSASKFIGRALENKLASGLGGRVAEKTGDLAVTVAETKARGGEITMESLLGNIVGSAIAHKATKNEPTGTSLTTHHENAPLSTPITSHRTLPDGTPITPSLRHEDVRLESSATKNPSLLMRGDGRSPEEMLSQGGLYTQNGTRGVEVPPESAIHAHTNPRTNGDGELLSATVSPDISVHYAKTQALPMGDDPETSVGYSYLIDSRAIPTVGIRNSESEFVMTAAPAEAIIGAWKVHRQQFDGVEAVDGNGNDLGIRNVKHLGPDEWAMTQPKFTESVHVGEFWSNPLYRPE